jgi:aminobenzoyl-glutamate utilization protein B
LTEKRHKWFKTTGSKREDPSGGSTDVGDVSYIVPEITLMATTAPYESLPVVASG